MKKHKLIETGKDETISETFGISAKRFAELDEVGKEAFKKLIKRKGEKVSEALNELIGVADTPTELVVITYLFTAVCFEYKKYLEERQVIEDIIPNIEGFIKAMKGADSVLGSGRSNGDEIKN